MSRGSSVAATPVRVWKRVLAVLAAAGVLAVLPVPVVAGTAPGTLDVAFGDGGVLNLDLPGKDHPRHMVTTATGSIAVAIDTEGTVAVAVLTPDGRLDERFARTGIRHLRWGAATHAAGLAAAPDGGILVGTWSTDAGAGGLPADSRFTIAKLLPNGGLDSRFGSGGRASTALGELTPVDHGPAAMAVGPDGATYVAGISGAGGYYGGAWVAVLLRFHPDGTRDTSFGAAGIALASPGPLPLISGLDVDRAGRILIGETVPIGLAARSDVIVRRFLPNGLPDPGFGIGGVAHVDIPGDWNTVVDVHADPAAKVVVYGYAASGVVGSLTEALEGREDHSWSPFAARLDVDGSPDARFAGGTTMIHHDPSGRPLLWAAPSVLDATGLIASALLEDTHRLRTTLLRVDTAGRLDPTFGSAPAVTLPMGNALAMTLVGSLVVVAGERGWASGGTVVAAYTR